MVDKLFFNILLIILILARIHGFSQTNLFHKKSPKLVVGIVVDQMRYDYITRFYNRFGEGGFKRMIKDGFSCKNHHFNYVPTTTAPGHASIFTGTTPQNHGIIGNSWYDKKKKEKVYCVEDLSVSPTGTSGYEGKMSPSQLQVTTIADQNRLHTQMRGKTIGISIKDRGAILAAGHTANAAYWFRGKNQGSWISSTYYIDALPKWVADFNDSDNVDAYLKKWDLLYDINSYTASGNDNTNFERGFKGKEKAIFPYHLQELMEFNGAYDIIKHTPYGNSLTVDFAIAALKGEQLGKDKDTDFLVLSFSSTDYIGHNFGVNSKEIEDTYLRLDNDLERLLNTLDITLGKNTYTLFLTSDHGATHVPQFLKSTKVPAGYFKEASIHLKVKSYIKKLYNNINLIEDISNNQVFLNYNIIRNNTLNSKKIMNEIAQFLLLQKGISSVYTRTQLEQGSLLSGTGSLVQKGFHQNRSGDVFYVLDPATIAYAKTGSTHGSGYSYDTHVPLLFFGAKIPKGFTNRRTTVSDIAPTISSLLGIALPNGATGNSIHEVVD